ncbi:MAG: hypothetical protein WBN18_05320 [Flavobacteriaceae bacterium]
MKDKNNKARCIIQKPYKNWVLFLQIPETKKVDREKSCIPIMGQKRPTNKIESFFKQKEG